VRRPRVKIVTVLVPSLSASRTMNKTGLTDADRSFVANIAHELQSCKTKSLRFEWVVEFGYVVTSQRHGKRTAEGMCTKHDVDSSKVSLRLVYHDSWMKFDTWRLRRGLLCAAVPIP
jgi:hypothetical protein